MLFNSVEYVVFLIATLAVSWLLTAFPRVRIWFILLASYYFYASNNGWLTLLIVFSTQFDYVAARAIAATSSGAARKLWLAGSVSINLAILCYFKYVNFFAETAAALAGVFGIELGWVTLNVVLPVGISFYTFEAISYVIDVYRGELKPVREWHRFALFITYFPHLIAGPIVRAGQFLPQIDARPRLDIDTFEQSMWQIARGLVKKIVFADTLAIFADRVFEPGFQGDSLTILIGVYAFTLQIFFDFSGYTDIALGSARLMGFRLPENFNHPYGSVSITDFWRRWHMTLSTWLRDYVYVPLGGNRMKSRLGVCRNLLVTMLIAGFWHGAAWHFVIWGGVQGAILAVERWFGWSDRAEAFAMRSLLRRALIAAAVFNLTAMLWILFRAVSVRDAIDLYAKLFVFNAPATITVGGLLVLAGTSVEWARQTFHRQFELGSLVLATPVPIRAAVYGVIGVMVVVLGSGQVQPFIYFRF